MARALDVSIDQLAELLAEPEKVDTTRALSSGAEVPPEARSGRVELEDLIPQVTETVEALRRALRSAGVDPEDLNTTLLVGGSSRVPPVPAEPDRPVGADPQAAVGSVLSELPTDIARPADIDAAGADVEPAGVQRRQASSRRFMRFAAAGVLALVLAEAAASVPFITSRSGPIPPTAAGTPAPATPVATSPVPDPGNDSAGAVHTTPPAAPNQLADGPAAPGAAVVPAPHTTRATSKSRTTSRSRPPAATTPRPPRTPAIPAEVYAWTQGAPLTPYG